MGKKESERKRGRRAVYEREGTEMRRRKVLTMNKLQMLRLRVREERSTRGEREREEAKEGTLLRETFGRSSNPSRRFNWV